MSEQMPEPNIEKDYGVYDRWERQLLRRGAKAQRELLWNEDWRKVPSEEEIAKILGDLIPRIIFHDDSVSEEFTVTFHYEVLELAKRVRHEEQGWDPRRPLPF